jgi:hypothetical protein
VNIRRTLNRHCKQNIILLALHLKWIATIRRKIQSPQTRNEDGCEQQYFSYNNAICEEGNVQSRLIFQHRYCSRTTYNGQNLYLCTWSPNDYDICANETRHKQFRWKIIQRASFCSLWYIRIASRQERFLSKCSTDPGVEDRKCLLGPNIPSTRKSQFLPVQYSTRNSCLSNFTSVDLWRSYVN